MPQFDGVHAQVLGISVDSVPCLQAWADSLGGISYPLLSDFYPHGEVAQTYGVLRQEGYSERAIFVIDRQGLIRYVDVHAIDEQPDNDLLFQVLSEIEPCTDPLTLPPQPAEIDEPSGEVFLYCTPWCPDCRLARAYLRERSIPFVEVDISKDRAAARRVREWTGGYETTPTLQIRGRVVIDYNPSQLDEIFKA